jgi:hypothetical protein
MKKKISLSKQEYGKVYGKKWRAAHPDYHRKWKAAHPGRMTELTKQWRINNAEHYRLVYQEYNRKNAERNKEKTLMWQEANRAHYNEYMRKYMKDYVKGIRRKDVKKESSQADR